MPFNDFLHSVHGVNPVRRPDGSWVMPSPRLLAIWGAFVFSIGSAAHAYFLAIHNMLLTPLVNRMADGVAQGITFFVIACVFWYMMYKDYQREVPEQ